MKKMFARMLALAMTCVVPVSYTHLDTVSVENRSSNRPLVMSS